MPEFTSVLNHMGSGCLITRDVRRPVQPGGNPAGSTSLSGQDDKARYPEIITAGAEGETPYYTNSSHLPVNYTADVFDALDIQDELQTLYTSGTVFHAFLGEKLPDWKAAANLVRTIAENYKLPYYTMSPTYSICKSHGYLIGEHFTCPICGEKAEVYSRITGYYRPVQNWNEGKSQEYKDRTNYDQFQVKARRVQDYGCRTAKAGCCWKPDRQRPEGSGAGPALPVHYQDLSKLQVRQGIPKGMGLPDHRCGGAPGAG
ncbi:MAG: anaerobic ribonucleoside-triphosphate reductase [Hungatella sp.]|uniref:anaerobic ribonucleoside-triphosphate reductase n=1 Tax=Hungatella sp. TaxID=2613924 RepID=UPI0039905FC9